MLVIASINPDWPYVFQFLILHPWPGRGRTSGLPQSGHPWPLVRLPPTMICIPARFRRFHAGDRGHSLPSLGPRLAFLCCREIAIFKNLALPTQEATAPKKLFSTEESAIVDTIQNERLEPQINYAIVLPSDNEAPLPFKVSPVLFFCVAVVGRSSRRYFPSNRS
jgi:hypothetical protein